MKKIFARNLTYLYTSIFCAGIQNIVTQMFFDRHYPEGKDTLMSIALFFGALFTMLGILASSPEVEGRSAHPYATKRSRSALVAAMVGTILLTFSGLFFVKSFLAYTILFSAASFCVNYIYNILDVFLTATVEEKHKTHSVRVLLGYQMSGYVIAPLFFSCFVDKPAICIGFTVIAGLLGYLPAGLEYVGRGLERSAVVKASGVDEASDQAEELSEVGIQGPATEMSGDAQTDGDMDLGIVSQDRLAMVYCFFTFMAFYVLMPSVAYLLKDYLGIENYAVQSSLFMAGVVVVSSLVIALGPAKKLWKARIATPVLSTVALLILMITRSSHPLVLAFAVIICGLGYGTFLSGGRSYVNEGEAERNLVNRYNKNMTIASLLAYLLAAGISFLCESGGVAVIPVKFCMIFAFLALAAAVSLFGTKRGNKQKIN
jgi:hypothetical protein